MFKISITILFYIATYSVYAAYATPSCKEMISKVASSKLLLINQINNDQKSGLRIHPGSLPFQKLKDKIGTVEIDDITYADLENLTKEEREWFDKIYYMTHKYLNKISRDNKAQYRKSIYSEQLRYLRKRVKLESKIKIRNRIKSLYFTDHELATKLNFSNQIDEMLSFPAVNEKEELRKTLLNNFKRSEEDEMSYDPQSRMITVSLPEELQGTDLDNFIRIHETRHALNAFLAGYDTVLKIEDGFHPSDAAIRYIDETSAMIQEWSYLNSIPSKIKANIVLKIQSSSLPYERKKLFIRVFSSEATSSWEYITDEHLANRYNKDSFR